MNEISCIMNVYKKDNAEKFRTAFLSVYNQTLKPTEIIIIRDGLVPENLEKCLIDIENEFELARVIRLNKNVGLGIGRQIAVNESKYDLIATMDSDDISVPNRFELESAYLEKNPNIDVVGGYISEFDDDTGKTIGWRKVPLDNDEIIAYNKKRCPMNHVTVMMKKKQFYNQEIISICYLMKIIFYGAE